MAGLRRLLGGHSKHIRSFSSNEKPLSLGILIFFAHPPGRKLQWAAALRSHGKGHRGSLSGQPRARSQTQRHLHPCVKNGDSNDIERSQRATRRPPPHRQKTARKCKEKNGKADSHDQRLWSHIHWCPLANLQTTQRPKFHERGLKLCSKYLFSKIDLTCY